MTGPQAGRRRTPVPLGLVLAALAAAAIAAALLRGAANDPDAGGGPRTAATGGPGGGPSPSSSPASPPPCRAGNEPAYPARYGAWDTVLLDTRYRLPPDYAPPDLVPVTEAGFASSGQVRAFVIPDLSALRSAAASAGHPIEVVAAYRSFAQQRDLFERRRAALGGSRALARTARPGHSEHQLGTAVDFRSRGARDVTAAWGSTSAGRWMAANAHRFGFVLSYPRGRTRTTCYPYEPWHFRYLGRGLAREVRASGLTLREYLWAHRPPREDG